MSSNLHMVRVTYLGPTNSRGSRVRITSDRFNQSVTLPYGYEFNSSLDIAEDWLTKNGFNIVGSGEMRNHFVIALGAVNNEFKPLKEQK